MSNDAHKEHVRKRMELTGENDTEAATRLARLAKIPNEPAPLLDREREIGSDFTDLAAQNWDGDGRFRESWKDDADGTNYKAAVQHNNTRRAGWALSALLAFQDEVGRDDESAVADLLCDLMHFCDAVGVTFAVELARGERHHDEEVRGEF